MTGEFEQAQGADQGHGHGRGGDQGEPAVAQAEQQHHEHQHHGIAQAFGGAVDAAPHVVGLIGDQLQLNPRGEFGGKLVDGLVHRFTHGDGIAAIPLEDRQGHRGLALEVGGDRVVALIAKLDPAHIPQQGDAAIGGAGHYQVVEVGGIAHPALHAERQGDLLA